MIRRVDLRFCLFVSGFFFLSVFSPSVYAAVVINEICPACDPEWVELYNTGPDEVDLTGWKLVDGNSSATDDLELSGLISSTAFITFNHAKGWLNDTGDTLTLTDQADATQDSTTFDDIDSGKTTSRIPDGTGGFVANTDLTPGGANQPLPSPTLTPIPTETPAPEPTATPQPSPTTAAAAASSTPTKSPTAVPTRVASPTRTPGVLGVEDTDEENSTDGSDISLLIPSPIREFTATPPAEKQSSRPRGSALSKILTGVGVLLLVGGGAPLLVGEIRARRSREGS